MKPTFKVKPRKAGKTKSVKLHMYGTTVTKQSFKEDCDINLIMARFVKTGIIDHVREHGPEYGFASSDDFRDSMELISKANSMFEELPSPIRNKFENDPARFLDFVQNPENIKEMQELGLAYNEKTENLPLAEKPEASGTPRPGSEPPATQEPAGEKGSD